MKVSKFICATAFALMASSAFAGWNDRSPVPPVTPSPYTPCNGPCNTEHGWNDRSPVVQPSPSPYTPCDRQCMIDSLKGFNDK